MRTVSEHWPTERTGATRVAQLGKGSLRSRCLAPRANVQRALGVTAAAPAPGHCFLQACSVTGSFKGEGGVPEAARPLPSPDEL